MARFLKRHEERLVAHGIHPRHVEDSYFGWGDAKSATFAGYFLKLYDGHVIGTIRPYTCELEAGYSARRHRGSSTALFDPVVKYDTMDELVDAAIAHLVVLRMNGEVT